MRCTGRYRRLRETCCPLHVRRISETCGRSATGHQRCVSRLTNKISCPVIERRPNKMQRYVAQDDTVRPSALHFNVVRVFSLSPSLLPVHWDVGWYSEQSRFESLEPQGFVFSTLCRPTFSSPHCAIQWVKRRGREADHSYSCPAK